ncbi:hypothetical protein M407DRAFT_241176 [Tulasnella calospora MUT 4182]|uniref:Uncharacterized protein n=1 Tax=Tulasnella calospora MUT 4182 TaxID=1051891 RepID=A0A0C3QWF0_9AGAM|nr:hypothetical protein M407DRAFT_241176 [Tulasnella calospora MUT 4182]
MIARLAENGWSFRQVQPDVIIGHKVVLTADPPFPFQALHRVPPVQTGTADLTTRFTYPRNG